MSQQSISISFPDGNQKEYPSGVTGREIASSISKGLAHEALSITLNGDIRELDRPIKEDGNITINKWESEEGKYTFWHSSAHVLAEAIQDLYPEAKFGIGPPVEQGFYYDVDFGETDFSEDDLEALEKKMLEKARKKSKFNAGRFPKAMPLPFIRKEIIPTNWILLKVCKTAQSLFILRAILRTCAKGRTFPIPVKSKPLS